jgi:hypothetical protein
MEIVYIPLLYVIPVLVTWVVTTQPSSPRCDGTIATRGHGRAVGARCGPDIVKGAWRGVPRADGLGSKQCVPTNSNADYGSASTPSVPLPR